MKITRKSFLKVAGAVVAVGIGGGPNMAEAEEKATRKHGRGMAHGLTLLTMNRNGEYRLGVKTEKGVLDVVEASKLLHMYAPATMDELLQNEEGPSLKALVVEALRAKAATKVFLSEDAIVFGPVVTRPEKIVCVGLNYRQHAKEVKMELPKNPVLFNKYNNALSAHKGTVSLPTDIAKNFDYEVELVLVIGKHAKNVSEKDALDYLAGYCTGNDFSARDLQLETGGQWMQGKTCDGFGVLGPYLVTSDLADPDNLKIECRVNGQTRQSSSTSDFIFNTRQQVSYISQRITLKPGDIIYTGTPQGVIQGKPKDQRVWLKAGDQIACSVEKLGELKFDLA